MKLPHEGFETILQGIYPNMTEVKITAPVGMILPFLRHTEIKNKILYRTR